MYTYIFLGQERKRARKVSNNL